MRLGHQFEGLGEVAQGVAGCERGERGVACPARVVDRLVEVDRLRGAEPVARELADSQTGPVAAELLERLRDLAVRPRPAGRAELLVERVLDERVREVVATRRIGELAHQRRRGGRVKDVEQIVLGASG